MSKCLEKSAPSHEEVLRYHLFAEDGWYSRLAAWYSVSTQPGSTDLVLQGNHCSLHRGEHALQLQLHWEIKPSQEIQKSVSFHGTASFDVTRALKQQQHLLFWRNYWGRRGSRAPLVFLTTGGSLCRRIATLPQGSELCPWSYLCWWYQFI